MPWHVPGDLAQEVAQAQAALRRQYTQLGGMGGSPEGPVVCWGDGAARGLTPEVAMEDRPVGWLERRLSNVREAAAVLRVLSCVLVGLVWPHTHTRGGGAEGGDGTGVGSSTLAGRPAPARCMGSRSWITCSCAGLIVAAASFSRRIPK